MAEPLSDRDALIAMLAQQGPIPVLDAFAAACTTLADALPESEQTRFLRSASELTGRTVARLVAKGLGEPEPEDDDASNGADDDEGDELADDDEDIDEGDELADDDEGRLDAGPELAPGGPPGAAAAPAPSAPATSAHETADAGADEGDTEGAPRSMSSDPNLCDRPQATSFRVRPTAPNEQGERPPLFVRTREGLALDTFPIADCTARWILQQWGPGSYRITFIRRRDDGRLVGDGARVINIEPPARGRQAGAARPSSTAAGAARPSSTAAAPPPATPPPAPAAPSWAPAAGMPDMWTLFQMMQAQNERAQELALERERIASQERIAQLEADAKRAEVEARIRAEAEKAKAEAALAAERTKLEVEKARIEAEAKAKPRETARAALDELRAELGEIKEALAARDEEDEDEPSASPLVAASPDPSWNLVFMKAAEEALPELIKNAPQIAAILSPYLKKFFASDDNGEDAKTKVDLDPLIPRERKSGTDKPN